MSNSKEIRKRSNSAVNKAENQHSSKEDSQNPTWFKPVMFGFMLLGLVWIVVYYTTSSTLGLPIPALGQNNIFVGFGLILVGFLMTTRWK